MGFTSVCSNLAMDAEYVLGGKLKGPMQAYDI